jgi:holin-like protein
MVLSALLVLLVCQLAGEVLRTVLHIPVPGPVLGMLLLAGSYAVRRRDPGKPMRHAADGLLRWLGLLFVPAGVGVVANLDLLRAAWLPVVVALFGSTLLTLLTTALLMHWLVRSRA